MIAFREYRAFEQARIAANDSSMALLVGSRLAIETLQDPNVPSGATLPKLYPHLDEVRYVTLQPAQAVELLSNSERYLAYMAIPFIVSVHETFLQAALRMLAEDGRWSGSDGRIADRLDLRDLHEEIFTVCRAQLATDHQAILDRNLSLFDFIRLMRVRLVHYGGASGQRLREQWKALSPDAKEEWVRLAKLPFEARDHEPLPLTCDDLIAVLAITKHIAETVNRSLEQTLSRSYWAKAVVVDYRDTNPRYWPEQQKRLQRIRGHARFYYGSLELTADELEGALAAVETTA